MNTDENQLQKLINAHKLGQIISPLAEATEITRHTGGVSGVTVSALFDEVLKSSGTLYEKVMGEGNALPDMSVISDSIFVTLAKAIRNNTVIFNNPSLQMLHDDMVGLIENHHGFIANFIEKNGENDPQAVTLKGEVTAAIMTLYTPMWRFHLSLYTSGFIGNEKLSALNTRVATFLLDVVKTVVNKKRTPVSESDRRLHVHYFKLCAEMVGLSLHEYQAKLIKNKDKLKQYVDSPEELMNKLVPVIYAHFLTFEKGVDEAMEHLAV